MGPNVDNLTDTQREQIKTVMDQHRDEMQGLTQRTMTARAALEDAVAASPVDESAIHQRSVDLGTAEGALAVARAHMNAEIFALLTPEQQQQLEARRSQMKERMKSGQRGRPRPPQ